MSSVSSKVGVNIWLHEIFLCIKIIIFLLVCCQMFGVHGPPSPGALWITTGLGDVFVFDPAILEVSKHNLIRNKIERQICK